MTQHRATFRIVVIWLAVVLIASAGVAALSWRAVSLVDALFASNVKSPERGSELFVEVAGEYGALLRDRTASAPHLQVTANRLLDRPDLAKGDSFPIRMVTGHGMIRSGRESEGRRLILEEFDSDLDSLNSAVSGGCGK